MEKSNVIKLDLKKSNYNEWRTQIIGALKANGVYKHLTTKRNRPEGGTTTDAEKIYWDNLEEKAQGILLSSLGGTEGNFVDAEQDSAATIWDKLESRHVAKMASEVELKRKALFQLKKQPSTVMAKFCEEFNTKLQDFEKLGGRMTELEKCRTFLSALDQNWQHFKMANDTREQVEDIDGTLKENKLKLESLFLKAKEAQNIVIGSNGPANKLEANYTESNSGGFKSKTWSPNLRCGNCGGLGHVVKFCPSADRPKNWTIKASAKIEKQDSKDSRDNKKPNKETKTDMAHEGNYSAFEAHFTALSTGIDEHEDNDFYLDNACTQSLVKSKDMLHDYEEVVSETFKSFNNSQSGTVGKGTLKLQVHTPTGYKFMEIPDVYWVPDSTKNLISEGHLVDLGYLIERTNVPHGYIISKDGVDLVTFYKYGRYYTMTNGKVLCQHETNVVTASNHLWHSRLGHPADGKLPAVGNLKAPTDCKGCSLAKMKALPHYKSTGPSKYKPGDLVVGDYKSVKEADLEGNTVGFFVLIDRATGYNCLYPVEGKEQQQNCFERFYQYMKTQFNIQIKVFRHDQGTEYMNTAFQQRLEELGVQDQSTAGYSPESNGVAESRFRVLNKIATSLLGHANLKSNFYLYAIRMAAKLYNSLPNVHGDPPITKLTGKAVDYDQFKVFGCRVVYFVPKEKRQMASFPGRLYPGRTGRFIGFPAKSDGFLIWNGTKVIISRDVKFFEEKFYFDYETFDSDQDEDYAYIAIPDNEEHLPTTKNQLEPYNQPVIEPIDEHNHQSVIEPIDDYISDTPSDNIHGNTESNESSNTTADLGSSLGNYWSLNQDDPRAIRLANRHNRSVNLTENISQPPKNYFDMKKLPSQDQKKWQAAMHKEHENLQALETYELVLLVDVPKNQKLIDTTWVYTLKQCQEPPEKARLCVRGDQEEKLDNLSDIFSTVVRIENFRLLITLIAYHDWELVVVDVKNAFPNADLRKLVFLRIPRGINQDSRKYCWKLKKALYGLRTSSADWNKLLTQTLKNLGFTKTQSDWNFFYKLQGDQKIYVIFHVDDGIITSNDPKQLDIIIAQLQESFEIKVEKNPTTYLKIDIVRDRVNNVIGLNQERYIKECAEKFKITEMRPYSTPMEPGFIDTVDDNDVPLPKDNHYRSIIGALLYIARMTRPDVLYAVSVLSKHLVQPQAKHWNAAKRVLAYLYHTKHENLVLGNVQSDVSNDNDLTLQAFADATWGDDLANRRSRSGGVMLFNKSMISCWSKQQATTALSSTDAEYQALSLATQEIIYYRQLFKEIGYEQHRPTILFGDNKGALALTVSTKHHPRVKHIDIRFHFTREQVEMKAIELKYVPTTDQIADIFTKPLNKAPFIKLKAYLHVQAWGGVKHQESTIDPVNSSSSRRVRFSEK